MKQTYEEKLKNLNEGIGKNFQEEPKEDKLEIVSSLYPPHEFVYMIKKSDMLCTSSYDLSNQPKPNIPTNNNFPITINTFNRTFSHKSSLAFPNNLLANKEISDYNTVSAHNFADRSLENNVQVMSNISSTGAIPKTCMNSITTDTDKNVPKIPNSSIKVSKSFRERFSDYNTVSADNFDVQVENNNTPVAKVSSFMGATSTTNMNSRTFDFSPIVSGFSKQKESLKNFYINSKRKIFTKSAKTSHQKSFSLNNSDKISVPETNVEPRTTDDILNNLYIRLEKTNKILQADTPRLPDSPIEVEQTGKFHIILKKLQNAFKNVFRPDDFIDEETVEINDEDFYDFGEEVVYSDQPETNDVATQSDSPNSLNDREYEMCKGCETGVADALYVPCGHNYLCMDCAITVLKFFKKCCVCREKIESVQHFSG